MKNIVLIVLILLSSLNLAWASNELEQKSKLASKDDIIGEWEVFWQYYDDKFVSNDSYWLSPHQRFHFFSDNYLKHIISTNPLDTKTLTIWKTFPKTTRFEFTEKGFLVITRNPNDQEIILPLIVIENLNEPHVYNAPKLKKEN